MPVIAVMQSLYWARVSGIVPDRCAEVELTEDGNVAKSSGLHDSGLRRRVRRGLVRPARGTQGS